MRPGRNLLVRNVIRRLLMVRNIDQNRIFCEPATAGLRGKSMTAQQPGVDANPDLDAVWSPALARGLIRHDVMRRMCYCNGYTDLLGPVRPGRRSLAQRAMNSAIVAAIYERIWRPIMVGIMSLHGVSIAAERKRACAALQLGG